MATVRSRGARIRSNAFAYANLAPYVFFVLFPFYFMIVTSFKSNAELYNLKSIPSGSRAARSWTTTRSSSRRRTSSPG